jgi:hypothetical protein
MKKFNKFSNPVTVSLFLIVSISIFYVLICVIFHNRLSVISVLKDLNSNNEEKILMTLELIDLYTLKNIEVASKVISLFGHETKSIRAKAAEIVFNHYNKLGINICNYLNEHNDNAKCNILWVIGMTRSYHDSPSCQIKLLLDSKNFDLKFYTAFALLQGHNTEDQFLNKSWNIFFTALMTDDDNLRQKYSSLLNAVCQNRKMPYRLFLYLKTIINKQEDLTGFLISKSILLSGYRDDEILQYVLNALNSENQVIRYNSALSIAEFYNKNDKASRKAVPVLLSFYDENTYDNIDNALREMEFVSQDKMVSYIYELNNEFCGLSIYCLEKLFRINKINDHNIKEIFEKSTIENSIYAAYVVLKSNFLKNLHEDAISVFRRSLFVKEPHIVINSLFLLSNVGELHPHDEYLLRRLIFLTINENPKIAILAKRSLVNTYGFKGFVLAFGPLNYIKQFYEKKYEDQYFDNLISLIKFFTIVFIVTVLFFGIIVFILIFGFRGKSKIIKTIEYFFYSFSANRTIAKNNKTNQFYMLIMPVIVMSIFSLSAQYKIISKDFIVILTSFFHILIVPATILHLLPNTSRGLKYSFLMLAQLDSIYASIFVFTEKYIFPYGLEVLIFFLPVIFYSLYLIVIVILINPSNISKYKVHDKKLIRLVRPIRIIGIILVALYINAYVPPVSIINAYLFFKTNSLLLIYLPKFLMLGYLPIRYTLFQHLERSPLLLLRSYHNKGFSSLLQKHIIPVASRYGVIVTTSHELQKTNVLFNKSLIMQQPISFHLRLKEWKSWVIDAIYRSSIVIVDNTVESDGLKWEIEKVLELSCSSKMILINNKKSHISFDLPISQIYFPQTDRRKFISLFENIIKEILFS